MDDPFWTRIGNIFIFFLALLVFSVFLGLVIDSTMQARLCASYEESGFDVKFSPRYGCLVEIEEKVYAPVKSIYFTRIGDEWSKNWLKYQLDKGEK